jgi:4-diphosphocytidyl-2-C-methyl-D-erythritol kinase
VSFATLTARAPAKVNLGLFVGERRADGRHELATVMQSISLCDELTLAPSETGVDELICPGVAGSPQENLALQALGAFRHETGWAAPSARIEVVKRVPVAAGLGGGSADAAAVLRLAAAASGMGGGAPPLDLAAQLGADVPAQVQPGRWLAEGVGERLRALAEPSPFGVLVLPSPASLSTAAVYGELDRSGTPRSAGELAALAGALFAALATGAQLPPSELLANDLQEPALACEPSIAQALAQARQLGADHALVSGSGPTVLGLFAGEDGVGRASAAAAELRGRRPAFAAVPVDERFAAPLPALAPSAAAVQSGEPPLRGEPR